MFGRIVFMSYLKIAETPKFSKEIIAEVREYQTKNRPLEIAEITEREVTQYCYSNGTVIELKENGDVFNIYGMLDSELEQMKLRCEQVSAVAKRITESLRGWREPGIK